MGPRQAMFPALQQEGLFSSFPCPACLSVPSCEGDGLESLGFSFTSDKGWKNLSTFGWSDQSQDLGAGCSFGMGFQQ